MNGMRNNKVILGGSMLGTGAILGLVIGLSTTNGGASDNEPTPILTGVVESTSPSGMPVNAPGAENPGTRGTPLLSSQS